MRLHNQDLSDLPPLPDPPSITSLQLPGNAFKGLPVQLRHMTALTDLSLGDNELEALDASTLSSLSQLRALTLTGNRLTALPNEIGELAALELLAVGGNELSTLPLRLGGCTSLRTLNLANNALSHVPADSFDGLGSLRTLRLDGNPNLHTLPETLCGLAKLEALSAAACGLQALPEGLGRLLALSTLQVKDNRLTALPSSIGQLRQLRTLIADGNRLESLPQEMGGCARLRVLSLSVNRLHGLPPTLCDAASLEELRLDDNPLRELPEALPPALALLGLSMCNGIRGLPDAVGGLAKLTQLAVGAAKLRSLPPSLGRLSSLRTLQLSGNVLTKLPEELGELGECLTTLEISDNRLVTLPASCCNLGGLETLRVSENRLETLPDGCGRLTRLRILGVSANCLAVLPSSICDLSALISLEASSNLLTHLPEEIGRLTNLERLALDDNRLEVLPPTLAQLSRLRECGLAHNCLTRLPLGLFGDTAGSGGGSGGASGLLNLRRLRLQSNALIHPPDTSHLMHLAEPPLIFNNPFCSEGLLGDARTQAAKPLVALLLPGLMRSYAHGEHWKHFVASLAHAYEVKVYMSLWSIAGSVSSNFDQSADKERAERVDPEAIRRCYPAAARVELVGAEEWVEHDAEGFDGRYLNQWKMVARCWALMEADVRDGGGRRPLYVMRSRPDLKLACLPMSIERPTPYLAMQERLWGSDCFFFGDYESMRVVCAGLAPRFGEYTKALGQATSEPVMHRHIEENELAERLVRFARCCGIDRSE